MMSWMYGSSRLLSTFLLQDTKSVITRSPFLVSISILVFTLADVLMYSISMSA